MKFYLTLFLTKHSKDASLVQSARLKDLLSTQKLGEHVGRTLKLGEVMRWMPAVVSMNGLVTLSLGCR
jgi:hypothetical protein